MKRFFALLLAAALISCCLSFAGATSSETIKKAAIAQAISDAFDEYGFNYDYDASTYKFSLDFTIENTLEECNVMINVYEGGFMVLAFAPIEVNEEYMTLTAEYLCRVSADLGIGDFEMSFSSGAVWYKQYQIAEDTIPGKEDIVRALSVCVNMVEDYGDGIAKVGMLGYDPQTAFEECQQAN